jgi:hypothetical protein
MTHSIHAHRFDRLDFLRPVPNRDFAPAGLLTFAILLLAIVVTGSVAIVQTQPLLIP